MKLKITLAILLFINSVSYSYRSYFRNYSVENGLPFIQVNTIFQDSKGYLWIGGYGGLSKFDGNVFQNFSPKNGLVNYSVTSIAEDNKNNIWVATINGLSCYNGLNFKNYTVLNSNCIGLENDDINKLIFAYNSLWIATKRGLFVFENGKFQKIKNSDFKINYLLKSNNNELLIGSDLGLFLVNAKEKEIKQLGNCPEISSLVYYNQKCYVSTLSGLFFYDFDKRTLSKINDASVESKKLNSLAVIDNYLFIASDDGLIKYNNGKYKFYKINDNYNSNLLSYLNVDDENNLWIGTYSGLFRYRSDDFILFSKEDGINSNFIFQILRTKQNELFVASGGSGVYLETTNGFKNYNTTNGLIDDYVWGACIDNAGNIWCATNEGISVFDGSNFKSYNQQNGLLNNFCFTTFSDNKGQVWVGNKGGISIFNGKVFKTININNKPECDVSAIYKTKNNEFLFGAYQGGLYKLKNDKLIDFGNQIGVNSESVMAIEEDNLGNLYIGTFDGLYIYNNKKLLKIDTDKGLSSDLIYQLKIDGRGKYLWIGTNQGLNRLNLDKYHKNGEIAIYQIGKNDGFSGVECNTGAVLQEGDSTMWFGTVNGLYKFNVRNFHENIRPSKTTITAFKVNYEDTKFTTNTNLNFDKNSITFHYTGICFTNPEKVLYTIKLEGFDKSWRPASHVNIANYPNLPPGNYIFKVKSCNNEGVWNNIPATFKFKILPPWYKTLLFRIIALLGIGFLIYIILRNRANNIRETERKKLEQEIAIATNEMKALRSQMNPHFIFNSLNSIQHFVVSNDSEKASKYLNKFSKLIRLILAHSEKQLISLSEEIELLKLYVELEQVRFENKFSCTFDIDSELELDFIELPTMLLQPFVENAILHGLAPKQDAGILTISFNQEKSNIVCIVSDNGIGRKQSQSMKNKANNQNLSIATKKTTERIELLKKINHKEYSFVIFDIDENSKKGTTVIIKFPY